MRMPSHILLTALVSVAAAAACGRGATSAGDPGTPGDGDGPDASAASPDAGAPADPDAGTAAPIDAAAATPDAPPPPPIVALQGVDRASAFSVAEAQSLKTNHGVEWTGVYIGGACNAGSGWTVAQVKALATQVSWQFLPIWVGSQSPAICSTTTLTAARGTSDGVAAAARMAAFDWAPQQGIPIVLDLEAGTYTYSATDSLAYVQAWRDAVRAAGYKAYLYSNPTAINGLYDAGVKMDGAWPASWFYSSFESTVHAEDLDQLGTRYTNKNRAWQYAGDFAVTGAGDVDGDVSDLRLAPAPGGTNN